MLLVPAQAQEVTVLGEVPVGTSHLFDPSLSRNDYIQMSGGATQKADRKGMYVVRANGSVVAGSSSLWFRKGQDIRPGDTIVVPLSAERLPPLPFWSAVSTIIYNLAVATAAVKSSERPAPLHGDPPDMLNFALVGCGRIARRHADLLGHGEIAGARLAAVCDLDAAKARRIGDEFNVPHYTDMHQMVEAAKPDVIVVLTESGDRSRHVQSSPATASTSWSRSRWR